MVLGTFVVFEGHWTPHEWQMLLKLSVWAGIMAGFRWGGLAIKGLLQSERLQEIKKKYRWGGNGSQIWRLLEHEAMRQQEKKGGKMWARKRIAQEYQRLPQFLWEWGKQDSCLDCRGLKVSPASSGFTFRWLSLRLTPVPSDFWGVACRKVAGSWEDKNKGRDSLPCTWPASSDGWWQSSSSSIRPTLFQASLGFACSSTISRALF